MPAKEAPRGALRESPVVGRWLFRYRSYVPFALLPLVIYETYANRGRLADLEGLDHAWGFVCMGVAFTGVVIRALVVGHAPPGTSGRRTRAQMAEVLNTTGMYSLTRNPLYLGNLVITLGIVAAVRSFELSVGIFLLFIVYYDGIIAAEEVFLEGKFARRYSRWVSSTPWLFPRTRGWLAPGRPFSWKKFVKSEYQALFGIVLAVFIVETARRGFRAGEASAALDATWMIVFASTAFFYVVVRIIHKWTGLLLEQGR